MKRLIALLLILTLAFSCLAGAAAEEPPAEAAAVQEEVVPQEEAAPEEEPAEKPVEKPAEEPEEQPAEKPAEEPAEEPVEEPAEQLAEESAEEPAEEPAEKPAEEPGEQPAEESAEEPAEEPAEKPTEEPGEQPVKEPAEEPVEEPAEEPAEELTEEPEEEFKPDRIMNVGEEADGTVFAEQDYVIRLQGISGDIWIEAEASFALKMTVTDEVNGQVRAFRGSEDAPLVASLNGQAGRTYLLSMGAENGFAAGSFHIQISRAEEPAAEEAPEPEEKDDDGALADNSTPKTAATATLKTPTIKKITQKDASVTVTWKAVSGARKYRIYCKKGSGSWKLLATVTKTTYTHATKVTPSTSGNTFQYRVCAIGSGSSKSKYAVKSIIRLAAPAKVTVKKHSSAEDVAVVTWQKVKGATKYYVYYRREGASEYTLKKVSSSKTKTTIPVTGTRLNEVYVAAYATGGSRGARSAIKKITPYWYRVLLVGEYYYYDGNDDLIGSYYDAYHMETLFNKQTGKVKRLNNEDSYTITSTIRSFFGGATPNTVCVFMFSGHGSTYYDSTGKYASGTLCCSDGSYITTYSLKSTMDSLHVNNIVLLLASCGSGGFIDPNGEEKKADAFDPDKFNSAFVNAFRTPASNAGEFKAKGYTVIAAAAAHESGWGSWRKDWSNGGTDTMSALSRAAGYDYWNLSQNGKFNGWVSKKGDSNKDGKVSVKEAYTYAKKQVTRSHVQFYSSRSGLILFQ